MTLIVEDKDAEAKKKETGSNQHVDYATKEGLMDSMGVDTLKKT